MLTAAADDGQTDATVAVAERLEPFMLYEVQEGDTVSSIAVRFGVSVEYILWNNVDLPDEDFLEVGHMIVVPAGNGIMHEVRLGETLTDVAVRYGVGLEAIVESPFNSIRSADDILESQMVFVPGGTVWLPEAVAEPEEEAPEDAGAETGAPVALGPEVVDVAPVTGPASASGLIWPAVGPISSYYGPSHPLGIDIDMFNNPYGAVVAATAGVITFAGGNAGYSYGLYVIIMSPDGIETLYAHFSSIAVVQGQQVAQGQIIGNAGCTGYCTGNHLHFEVIDNGVRVNPLAYLP
jgi:murein DD-endopeptidase MepM/ murein hydrolase activator NlpD